MARVSAILLALLIGLVGAAIVHVAVVFTIPSVAEDNAWARLSRTQPALTPVLVEPLSGPQTASRSAFAFIDPAFMTSACRFSLNEGPVQLKADGQTGFWSASIYSRSGDNLYSINGRAALEGRFDLLVGSAEQLDEARIAGAFDAGDTIPVVVSASELYLTLRALVADESERPFIDRFIRSLQCRPVADLGLTSSAS